MDYDKALLYAAEYGHVKLCAVLLRDGADVHCYSNQSLRWAACHGHLEVCKLLLKHGADVHAWDNGALRVAAQYGHVEVCKLLIGHGANIDNAIEYSWSRGQKKFLKELKLSTQQPIGKYS